jgi:DNA-binding NtrC family response regulator
MAPASHIPSLTAPVHPAGGAPGVIQRTRRRILVVDDDALVLSSLRRLLDLLEVDVETCSDPERAMSLFVDGSFDLVIADECMPKMSGLEMLGRVRASSPQTPTILLTAFRNDEKLARAYERCGVFRFLTKPWDNLDLIATIRAALVAREAVA